MWFKTLAWCLIFLYTILFIHLHGIRSIYSNYWLLVSGLNWETAIDYSALFLTTKRTNFYLFYRYDKQTADSTREHRKYPKRSYIHNSIGKRNFYSTFTFYVIPIKIWIRHKHRTLCRRCLIFRFVLQVTASELDAVIRRGIATIPTDLPANNTVEHESTIA